MSKAIPTAMMFLLAATPLARAEEPVDTKIECVVRVLSVSEDFWEAADWCYPSLFGSWREEYKPVPRLKHSSDAKHFADILTDGEAQHFLQTAKALPTCTILSAPVLVTQDGRPAQVLIGTSLVAPTKDGVGLIMLAAINSEETVGTKFTVTPTQLRDGQISLRVNFAHSELVGETELQPVTHWLTPKLENGQSGKKVPFTQYVQKPNIRTIKLEDSASIPQGKTMMLVSQPYTVETKTESVVPILSEIPYLNRMFRTVGYGRESRQLVVLVTPRLWKEKPAATQVKPEPEPLKPHIGGVIVGTNSSSGLSGTIVMEDSKVQQASGACNIKVMPRCCETTTVKSSTMPLTDIVALTIAGLSEEVIINQIATTRSTYQLETEQLIWLHKQGVSERVIMVMQNTRNASTNTATVPPTAYRSALPTSTSKPLMNRETAKTITTTAAELVNQFAGLLLYRDANARYTNGPDTRMRQLLNESEDLRQFREERHLFWMNNQPSLLTHDRLNGAIGP